MLVHIIIAKIIGLTPPPRNFYAGIRIIRKNGSGEHWRGGHPSLPPPFPALLVGEGEGEVAFFSAKRWDRRNRADLIESATPCHDALVVGPYRDSNPLRLTVLAAMSGDYTTAPQHLQVFVECLATEAITFHVNAK